MIKWGWLQLHPLGLGWFDGRSPLWFDMWLPAYHLKSWTSCSDKVDLSSIASFGWVDLICGFRILWLGWFDQWFPSGYLTSWTWHQVRVKSHLIMNKLIGASWIFSLGSILSELGWESELIWVVCISIWWPSNSFRNLTLWSPRSWSLSLNTTQFNLSEHIGWKLIQSIIRYDTPKNLILRGAGLFSHVSI